MSKASSESSPSTKTESVPVPETPKETGKFICHSETVEDGKTWHYLYNPTEKDASKAWKRSGVCSV